MVFHNFDELIAHVKGQPSRARMAVAAAGDAHTIEAVLRARAEGIVTPILVGDKAVIDQVLHFSSTDSLSVAASSGRVYAARTASSTSRADNSVFSLMTHLSGSSLQNGIEPVVCFSQVQRIFPKWLSQWTV